MQNKFLAAITLLVFLEVSGGTLLADHTPSCSAPLRPVAACETCGQLSGCQPPGCLNGMPECSVCNGQPLCWDCSWEEGIDVDSLTPAAQSKKLYLASQARIMIELPEASGVYLLDQRMSMPGAKRIFVIPIPDQNMDYKYEVRVDVVSNGKKYFKRIRIDSFRAGMILALKVEAPPAAEGEPPQITVASEVLAEGGKPPEDSEPQEVMASRTILNR